jgi:hypothetical protein
MVLASRIASKATLALKEAVNERRFPAILWFSVRWFQVDAEFYRSKRTFLSYPMVLKMGSTSLL